MPLPSSVSPSFIAGLPKAELHVHLEGCLEPELKLQLAARNGIDLVQKTVEDIKATYRFHDLASFLAVYYGGIDLLVEEQDFYDLASSFFRRAAEREGLRRVEAFFDPQAHTRRGVPIEKVIRGYHRACTDAASYGLSAALIMCFLREESAESAMSTLEYALPFRDLLLGIGLDSDERGNPPAKFAAVYTRARELGLKLTAHADIDQPNSIEHIRQALLEIGVDRLDHGTNVVEDPALVRYLADKGIGLTCCPVSNSFVTPTMKAPEMLRLMEAGVKVTVNSDDPAYMLGAYAARNFEALAEKAGMTPGQIVELARNSFEIAWIPEEERDRYLNEIDEYVAGFAASEQ
ncbi:adenosine deaminase [Hyaloraphidium curvatum]|nr:adenosine deaminase [Hyaloraphidium curvatum]